MESEGSIIFELHLEITIQSGCQRNACIGSPKATCTEIHSSTSVDAPKIGTSAFLHGSDHTLGTRGNTDEPLKRNIGTRKPEKNDTGMISLPSTNHGEKKKISAKRSRQKRWAGVTHFVIQAAVTGVSMTGFIKLGTLRLGILGA